MPADHLALKKLFQTWQEGMQAHGGWNALFWCNHDQPRAVSRFGSDTTYWKERRRDAGGGHPLYARHTVHLSG